MPAYKANNGRWYCSFYYTDADGQRKKKKKSGFALKREAEAWERDFLTKHNPNEDEILSLPFDSFLDRYIADKTPHVKAGTLRVRENIIRKHLKGQFKQPLNQLTASTLQHWINQLSKQDYADGYIKFIITLLKAVFNHAERLYGLSPNPVKRLTMPPKKDGKKEILFWTLDDFNKAIQTIDDIQAKTELTVLFWSGLRKGELYALRWSDLEEGAITISKTYTRLHGKANITPPKTPGSNRRIALPDIALEALQQWKDKTPDPTDDGFIFPWSANRIKKAIIKASKATGVKRIRVHDLRHSHASLLINQGANIKLISQRLGHAKTSITLDTYGHLYPSDEYKLIDGLNRLNNEVEAVKNE